ncbi:Leu/Phe/Val dehydrogenase [Alkalicoccus urumqiensis]|uniref:Leucine dehydrogenase n=1 Tax=Alkalicoccus urumqiensis TaxID=1548213 RepID=A0A2P6MKD0_ALKUR|nr:Glu/Leu/Phe/Val dehydrogenase [Alkalicoccus urumqiensis]PRO66723.1 leucine dehydrogenase [Alkalicoccus urumqiensis]
MELFSYMENHDYEQVVVCQDRASGLKAFIAIHDTTLGPALGGTRMWTYESEEKALEDALRLARGMTYKNAAAGLNLGGGKTVIIGDPKKDKNEAMFRAFGRYIQGLNGRYITAEDVGTTVADMDNIYQETDYVTGVSPAFGSSGNPAPVTAYGVYVGIKAAAKKAFGTDDLNGKKIAVQGVGNVAYRMCEYLHKEGAELIVTDISEEACARAARDFQAVVVKPEEIYDVECDIYSPCALGATINDDTLSRLKASVIAGAANNQLLENRHGEVLDKLGIVYAPDYVINSGGVINVADELLGYNRERAMKKVETIYDSILNVFDIASRDSIPSSEAADKMAEERIEAMRRSRKQFLPNSHSLLSRGKKRGPGA